MQATRDTMKQPIFSLLVLAILSPFGASSQLSTGKLIPFTIPAEPWVVRKKPTGDETLSRYIVKSKSGDTLTIHLAPKVNQVEGVAGYVRNAKDMFDSTKVPTLRSVRNITVSGIPVKIGVIEIGAKNPKRKAMIQATFSKTLVFMDFSQTTLSVSECSAKAESWTRRIIEANKKSGL